MPNWGVEQTHAFRGLRLEGLSSASRGPFTADFPSGSCTVISGPSGIGKSLFLRMVADLDPSRGIVRLDGRDRDAMPAPHWRRLVTYVAAEPGWWAETLAEHMPDAAAARVLLPDLALDPSLLEVPVSRLSTGERQRAALVRAIVGRPRFLLLDEPTSALDAASRERVEGVLTRLKAEGTGLLVVSHDPDQARRIADRRFVMTVAGLDPEA